MPREVNVYIENFTPKGASDNYNADVRIEWINNAGAHKSQSKNVPWPQCLTWLPVEERMQVVQDLLIRCLRAQAGVDSE